MHNQLIMRGSQYGTLEWQETKTGLGIQEAGLRIEMDNGRL